MSSLPETLPSEIARFCTRNVTTIEPGVDVLSAAKLMRSSHNGFLVVCEPSAPDERGHPRQRVIGVLTDRDIVVGVVAREADPRQLKVADVMTRNPLLIGENCTVDAMLGFMQGAGVRRVPIIGSNEQLIGVISLDDVTEHLTEQLTRIVGAYRGEQRAEWITRP